MQTRNNKTSICFWRQHKKKQKQTPVNSCFMQFGVNGLNNPLVSALTVFPLNFSTYAINSSLLSHQIKGPKTPALFLTWCRSPELSLHPSPRWTSPPSSSRWAGWRRRCSRRTPGTSGSKHFLQRRWDDEMMSSFDCFDGLLQTRLCVHQPNNQHSTVSYLIILSKLCNL